MTASLLQPVRELADEPAVSVAGQGLTYGELREAAAALATRLRGAGRVAVWADSTLETCVAVVAAIEAGIPLVPVNPKLGESELTPVLSDSRPDVLVGAPDAGLPELEHEPRRVSADPQARGGDLPDADAGDEDPALIIYTSGTTGRPKGAVLPRRALASNLDALADAWDWTGEDTVAHGLPLFHVHGLVLGTLGPVRRGGTAQHLGRFSAEAAASAMEGGATMLFAVPTMYHRLSQEPEACRALGRARLLVSGSAALPAVEHERIERLSGQRIAERYGMTETLMNTAVRASGERRPGYVGPPLRDVELRLLDDDGHELDA